MPRYARIDMPGLLQHVIVRGIERSRIFLFDDDREDFVGRLSRLLAETRTRCCAWALLDNHFHLLLLPTEIPLAVLMRRLLTGYAVTFNQRHRRSGHLFQNRYKSIVCDADAYLMELVRYIHLNPVRAGVVKALDDLAEYRWCGHRQLLGQGRERLLAEDEVLALFARSRGAARKSYLQFLADGSGQDLPKLSQGGRRVSQAFDGSLTAQDLFDDRILGGGGFVERVLVEKPEAAQLSLAEIIEAVSGYFGIPGEELSWPGKARAVANAKAVVCFLAIRQARLSGVEVGRWLGYTSSAVSRATQRGQGIFAVERGLRSILK